MQTESPPRSLATTPRDYWVARHPDGSHYWIFRELDEGGWFLHGIFA
jgi:hypothetical protein